MHFEGGFGETEALNFGNHNDGPGVRTPGFWKSKFGKEFWNGVDDNGRADGTARKMPGADGIVGTEDDAAFADFELVEMGAETFTIGDGASATTLTLDLACKLIDASQKAIKNDGKWKLGRDMVATELNLRAGNPAGEAEDLLNEAANWLGNVTMDKNGDGVIDTREFNRFSDTVLMDEFLWQEAQFGNENSAATLHDQLDLYNNSGDMMLGGITTTLASDGDFV